MEALYLLIPLSVILVALAVWIFFGAAESGQFEDLDGAYLGLRWCPVWLVHGGLSVSLG